MPNSLQARVTEYNSCGLLITLTLLSVCLIRATAQVGVSVNVDGQRALNGVAPPDPNAAVGPNYILEYVNTSANFNIYDKSGNFISSMNDGAFFGFGTGGDGHVIYNENTGRFAAEELSTNGVVFAVSDTSDPRGPGYFCSQALSRSWLIWPHDENT